MLRRPILILLAVGAVAVVVEGTIIGIRYVWLDPKAPWLFRLMLPGMFVGLAIVLGLGAWSRARARRAKDMERPDFLP